MNVVWFKRDLRCEDNQALSQALKSGPVLPLYILEPDLWLQPDLSQRQYLFERLHSSSYSGAGCIKLTPRHQSW